MYEMDNSALYAARGGLADGPKLLSRSEAMSYLGDAWWGGKHLAERRVDHDYLPVDCEEAVLARIPLVWVRPNEAGTRYDGTVLLERAVAYASAPILAPIHLLFSVRAVKHGANHAAVSDGGHRVTAARMRGEVDVAAILTRQDYERLVSHRCSVDVASRARQALAFAAQQPGVQRPSNRV